MGIPVRILVADDHAVVRQGLCAVLETQLNFAVCAVAADGREAVDLALAQRPDVAILDISMPILNGIEAARQIREGSPTTEVLIFTMHEGEELIGEVLHAGARGYLLKTDTDDRIIEAIDTLVRHRPYFPAHVSETWLDKTTAPAENHSALLSPREREIVQLIAEGGSNKRIALLLDISIKTVETHRASAMRKLNIRSTAELVRYAVRNKLIQA
jgi:DNA-binding NarL/FixJ family response regulator